MKRKVNEKLKRLEDLCICESCGHEVDAKDRMSVKCPKCGGIMKRIVVVR